MRSNIMFFLFSLLLSNFQCLAKPEFSIAGFYPLEYTGRTVYSMNPGWRFYKGDMPQACEYYFDDSQWDKVNLPNGMEILPLEASGCINYQGVSWYRKKFKLDSSLKDKKIFIHFEAVMGKSEVYINGKLIKQHFSGYFPIVLDLTDYINWEGENVLAVKADNSDDSTYPPGKFQDVLDFTYSGGIYRDCWLIAHNKTYISDPMFENKVAGGGLFISYDNVSQKNAHIRAKLHIRNEKKETFQGSVEFDLQTSDGKTVSKQICKLQLIGKSDREVNTNFHLNHPDLWSPQTPNLYHLVIYIRDKSGTIVDGYMQKIGVRSIEFKGEDGFWLNGEPYPEAIIGGNRHQDFAVVGNALSNSMHWRDAKKLRDAGMTVIRNAHYPQDPAFMDACDELGLLVIENIPGWQYWDNNPLFEERVYRDIRNMVRRDRNRPSVWMWEPILNETNYPDYFAKRALDIVNEEYPYPYCYAASDATAKGSSYYPVIFTHPQTGDKTWAIDAKDINPNKVYFTREWGDNVDDWYAQNSSSRIARNWGEYPMLIQSFHYQGSLTYSQTSYTSLRNTTRQHIGGALWHSFDHQRGYHPDPFYGGIMDVFRQPKYSYYMFQSQRNPYEKLRQADSGPMIYIANEMTPGSVEDVVVFTNCDSVRLIVNNGEQVYTHKRLLDNSNQLRSPAIVFKNAYNFMNTKYHNDEYGKRVETSLTAEGYLDNQLVVQDKVFNAGRPVAVKIWLDNEGTDLIADGSDLVTVLAAIVDERGNIKRLSNQTILFEIEGEGELIADERSQTNPIRISWGTAPILLRSTTQAGEIKIKASTLFHGSRTPIAGEISLRTIQSKLPLIYHSEELKRTNQKSSNNNLNGSKNPTIVKDDRLKEVEEQQAKFGEHK